MTTRTDQSQRSPQNLREARERADDVLRDERGFVDALLDAVEGACEDLRHEIANLRSEGREADARAFEAAMRPLDEVRSGVIPSGK